MKKLLIMPGLIATLALPSFSQTIADLSNSQRLVKYQTNIDEVDTLLNPWNNTETPGASVIVIKDGRTLLKKGYGLSNIEKKTLIGPDTAFLLGSVTKQFTAMAIMMLAERGKLKYEDSLTKYFPEFPAYAEKITIRHLLNHTAGLPEYDALFLASNKMDRNWPRSIKSTPSDFEPTSIDALRILSQVNELCFTPGEKWEYSNSGYVILAQIVEKVSNESFAKFLQKNIFNPLGMNRTILNDQTQPKIQNVATSYTLENDVYKEIDYAPQNAIYGEDNIYTTIEDMSKWDQALYTEELVKAVTLKEAFTPGKLNDGTSTHYGFGWFVNQLYGFDIVAHGGSWLGFRTAIVRFPGQHFTVVVLANSAQFKVNDVAKSISKIFLLPK